MAKTSVISEIQNDGEVWDEIETVDGSDIDRLINELNTRGGADAILGRFLRDKLNEYWSTVDPECCVGSDD